jgi:cellulose biosynthesis protein BcsQ
MVINKVAGKNVHKAYTEEQKELAKANDIKYIYTIKHSVRVEESQALGIPLLEYNAELNSNVEVSSSLLEYAIELEKREL